MSLSGVESTERAGERPLNASPPDVYDNLRTLTEYFALVHGTDTCGDGVRHILIRVPTCV